MATTKKRFIALVLAFATLCTFMASCMTAFAADPEPEFDIQNRYKHPYSALRVDNVLVRYNGTGGDVVIPEGVEYIAYDAFTPEVVDQITSLTLPSTLEALLSGPPITGYVGDGDEPNPLRTSKSITTLTLNSDDTYPILYGPVSKEAPVFNYPNLETINFNEKATDIFISQKFFPEELPKLKAVNFSSSHDYDFASARTMLKEFLNWDHIDWDDPNAPTVTFSIPDGVTEIGEGAFSGCRGLRTITIPDSVKALGQNVFGGCPDLTDVTLPRGLTEISIEMFRDCPSLTHISIPEGVTAIGASAFEGCTGLTSITIPSSVTKLHDRAFFGCTALENIVFDTSTVSADDDAFTGTPWLETLAAQSGDFFILGTTLERYQGSDPNVVIPDGVTRVASYAFDGCEHVQHITYPESIIGLDGISRISYLDNVAYNRYSFVIPENTLTVTFPKKGSLVEEAAALKGFQFLDRFPNYNLQRVINCPNSEAEKQLAMVDVYTETWVNPGSYVASSPQSERVTQVSNEITAGLTGDYEKAEAICRWVTKNIAYDYDYRYNRKNTVARGAEAVLDARLTVCAGYAELTRALLQAQGIPVRYLAGQTDDGELHAWNIAFVDGRWITIDTTWGIFDVPLFKFVERHRISETAYRYSSYEKDIPSGWAKEETWEAISSYVAPYDLQSSYRSAITREEFCRLMVTLVEKSVGQNINSYIASKGLSVTDPFTDTNTPEVLAAYALGIVKGTSANTFNPSGSITRQEAATMLARTAKVLGLSAGSGMTFADAGSFASWSGESIAFVSGLTDPVTGNKVMNGTGNGRFSPAGTYTREQAIVTALRLFHCAESE